MTYAPLFVLGQTDTLPQYTMTLTDTAGNPVNLTTATSVTMTMANIFAGSVVTGTASIISAVAGVVQFTFPYSGALTPGVYSVQWLVEWSGSTQTTYPHNGYNYVTVTNNITIGFPDVTATFNTIWNGASAPTSAIGNNGDYYYNTTTGYFYGPKSSGTWPAGYPTNASLIPLNNVGAPTGSLSMNGQKIINLQSGFNPQDAVAVIQMPSLARANATQLINSTGATAITGLTSATLAVGTYLVELVVPYSSTSTAGTPTFSFSTTTTVTSSTIVGQFQTASYQAPSVGTLSTSFTGPTLVSSPSMCFSAEGYLTISVAGTLSVQALTSVGADTFTTAAGAYLRLTPSV